MDDKLYTTGQTSGLTNIPPQTMRRYINDFGEFLSESARKTTKGRRFTQQDIKCLLLIRHLHFERNGNNKIRAALRGEWQPLAQVQYDNQDALQLVIQAKEQMQATDGYTRQARQAANQATGAAETANRIVNAVKQATTQTNQNLEKRLVVMEKRIEALELELAKNAQKQKRSGFWSGMGG